MLSAVILGAAWGAWQFLPNFSHEEPEWAGKTKPVFIEGQWTGDVAVGEGKTLKLPLPLVQKQIDAYAYGDPDNETVVLTTSNATLVLQEGSKNAKFNGSGYALNTPVEKVDGVMYVPVEPLERLYGIRIFEESPEGSVTVFKAGDRFRKASAVDGGWLHSPKLRSKASIRSPIVAELEEGTPLRVWKEQKGWLYAQTDDGHAGYIQSDELELHGEESIPVLENPPTEASRKWLTQKINLAWEAVYERKPNPEVIEEMQGVNVVSPTWFSLKDSQGNIGSKADSAYVGRAHNRGKQVWALFSNGFEADWTQAMLKDYETRARAIEQVLAYAKRFNVDGINLDFENVYTEDKAPFVEFVREFTVQARAEGLTVSIDVTPKSSAEMWSAFLDRRALAETVDFLIVMAYDEHWASSPEAGSVASLPWVEKSVKRILTEDEVPPSKLVLGVPLYTRLWVEKQEAGKTKISSSAVGMETSQRLAAKSGVKKEFLEDVGQNYVQYTEDGAIQRIWLEDAESLKRRVALVGKYELAGIASWARNFASAQAWEVLQTVNNK